MFDGLLLVDVIMIKTFTKMHWTTFSCSWVKQLFPTQICCLQSNSIKFKGCLKWPCQFAQIYTFYNDMKHRKAASPYIDGMLGSELPAYLCPSETLTEKAVCVHVAQQVYQFSAVQWDCFMLLQQWWLQMKHGCHFADWILLLSSPLLSSPLLSHFTVLSQQMGQTHTGGSACKVVNW